MSAEDNRSVIAAVDGRPSSAGALRYAATEALRSGGRLHLVHVWPGYLPQDLAGVAGPAEAQAEGHAVLDEATTTARRWAPGLDITTDLVVGPRAAGILSAARGGRLLVVGRPPRHHTAVPFLATVTAVAARSEMPTVVVPSSWVADRPRNLIVVGMKMRTHARELLSHAFETAQQHGARIVVLTAWELYDPTMDHHEVRDHAGEWDAEGRRVLDDLVQEWRECYPGVPVDLRVTHGRAARVLEHASVEADLLVLARRLHARPPYGRLGGTAHTLLQTSGCPVEVVPARLCAKTPALPSSGSGPI
jgi:nucleotide-binding universal stress UspA family protein